MTLILGRIISRVYRRQYFFVLLTHLLYGEYKISQVVFLLRIDLRSERQCQFSVSSLHSIPLSGNGESLHANFEQILELLHKLKIIILLCRVAVRYFYPVLQNQKRTIIALVSLLQVSIFRLVMNGWHE